MGLESYQREFSEYLPLQRHGKSGDMFVDANQLHQKIRQELLEGISTEKKEMVGKILEKLDIAAVIVGYGTDEDLLYRGAIELRRIIPCLTAQILDRDHSYLFDELSQLYVKGAFEYGNFDSYELTDRDIRYFEALGKFGFENDVFNEQPLSSDYYVILSEASDIGQHRVQQVVEWLVS